MSIIKRFFKKAWIILNNVRKDFKHGDPIVYSAAIAFFTIFSLPAISIILTLIGSAFFDEEKVRTEIVKEVDYLVSSEAAEQVSIVIENALEVPAGFWGITIGIVVVLQSSSIMFYIIQKGLNSVWKVKPRSDVSMLRLLRHRLRTLAMVIGLGLLFTLSLMLDTTVAMFSDQLRDVFEQYFSQLYERYRQFSTC
ncbi:hypothetical protein GCM10028895_46320 [Pontibacter rugosus]